MLPAAAVVNARLPASQPVKPRVRWETRHVKKRRRSNTGALSPGDKALFSGGLKIFAA